ncbi:MAG: hypothetical protein RSD40_05970 [Bacilli bacterium]
MKEYVIEVKRIKTNEFEVKAKSLREAEQMVRDVVFNSSVLNLDMLNQNNTKISIKGNKIKKNKTVKRICKYF